MVEGSRILREHGITQGRLQGNGLRAKTDIADYVLVYRNTKLAVRFTYASNGRAIYGIDMETGVEGDVLAFPGPDELWARRRLAHVRRPARVLQG